MAVIIHRIFLHFLDIVCRSRLVRRDDGLPLLSDSVLYCEFVIHAAPRSCRVSETPGTA